VDDAVDPRREIVNVARASFDDRADRDVRRIVRIDAEIDDLHRTRLSPMPIKSQAERAFLHATNPAAAAKMEADTPKGAKLPEHVHHKAHSKSKDTHEHAVPPKGTKHTAHSKS
jgi:hypothetical protein